MREETKAERKARRKAERKAAKAAERAARRLLAALEVEETEVGSKVKELFTVSRGPMEGLSKEDRQLYINQLEAMQAYADTVKVRLNALKNPK